MSAYPCTYGVLHVDISNIVWAGNNSWTELKWKKKTRCIWYSFSYVSQNHVYWRCGAKFYPFSGRIDFISLTFLHLRLFQLGNNEQISGVNILRLYVHEKYAFHILLNTDIYVKRVKLGEISIMHNLKLNT